MHILFSLGGCPFAVPISIFTHFSITTCVCNMSLYAFAGPSAMRRAAAGSAALAAAAAGYSAAVRGSNHNNDNHWTFRSGIAYNAASAATDHNNNGNNWTFRSGMASNATSAATSAARRAMAAGILGAGGGEEDPDDLSLGDDDLWESVLQGVGELGQQQQHPLPHRHAAVHQLHQYHRRLSRSNNLSSNNNNNNIANGLPNLLDGAAVTNNNNARNNNNTRLGGGGEANSNRQRFYEAARAFSLAGNHRELLFGQAPSAPPVVLSAADANALLRAATANAALYQPQWSRNINSSCNATAAQRHASTAALDTDATQMQVDEQLPSADTVSAASSPAASTNDNCRAAIQVGSGMEGDANNNIAHVPIGAAEGLAIRAAEPLPRTDRTGNDANNNPFSSFRLSSPAHTNATTATTTAGWNPSDDDNTPHRRVFGFRVAFDHPTSGNVVGANMGGCYLIGVTTSSYTRFGEQDSLRQSPFFWGVEDGGQVFEGPRSGQQQPRRLLGLTATENRSSSSSATTAAAAAAAFYAMDGIGGSTSSASTTVAAAAASRAMNEHSVLFGARQVVTIVCDMDLRTLTFWREETLLGTLVTNLPRNGNLYPVVVPFNCGVTVAITGLGNNPLSLYVFSFRLFIPCCVD